MWRTRPLTADDFDDAHILYVQLTNGPPPPAGDHGREAFAAVLAHPGTTILGAEVEARIAGMATLHVMPNLTYGGRPYALVENVVTRRDMHGRGVGRAVMEAATEQARTAGCYKIMLLTGQGRGAKGLYEKVGFSAHAKHGMIRRLKKAARRKPGRK